eukprot:TRINITY_DN3801_c0_g2_i4.p1 TRINITY_DN3801_c0_g2~~TRINITY_DN3801_c0_g2_i4.p1  ORF type:complete len:327 (-),score=37.38 TRINITY_DN3801_c0_g2_i4:169-1122(-)
MDGVPVEIFSEVFSYLDLQTVLATCSIVCRKWNVASQTVPSIWRELHLNFEGNTKKFERIGKKYGKFIKILHISQHMYCSDLAKTNTAQTQKNLSNFNYDNFEFIRHYPELINFTISGGFSAYFDTLLKYDVAELVAQIATHCKKLEKYTIPKVKSASILQMLDNLHNLKKMTIQPMQITKEVAEAFGRNAPKLTQLRQLDLSAHRNSQFTFEMHMNDSVAVLLVQNLPPTVVKLSFSACEMLGDPVILAIAENCPQLEEIALYRTAITGQHFDKLFQNCLQLKSYNISRTRAEDFVRSDKRIQQLKAAHPFLSRVL